jgi:hypothetical protein
MPVRASRQGDANAAPPNQEQQDQRQDQREDREQSHHSADGDNSAAVARRAYERFLARGGEHGRDQEDWFEAERELGGRGE